MKTTLILLAIIAYTTAASIDLNDSRSISSAITNVILNVQEQMPCGFSSVGVPPLAPLKTSHQEVNIDTSILKVQGSLENFKLNGLNDFTIEQFTVNPLTSKGTFRFIFQNVNVDTDYDLDTVFKKSGFTIHLVGKGKALFAVKDIEVRGNFKYSLNFLTGKLQLKSLDVRTHIDDVESNIQGILGDGKINKKMNTMLEDVVQLGINENEDQISELIEARALPIINKYLKKTSLNDLVGGNDDNDDDHEKVACIPPSL